jgi:hypothetical protein
MIDDSSFAEAEWLSSEEAIAHIRACIWWKDAQLSLRLPLSMVARTHLTIALEDERLPARGPLRPPHDMPPAASLWLDVDIPSTFWLDSDWDGRSGFRNRSSLEVLPRFEVPKKELYDLWSEADRVSMPAPFDVDWPPLEAVIEAMMERLDVSRQAAHQRLIGYWREKNIKASKRVGSHGSYVFDEWERADPNALHRADAQWADELGATGTNGGREPVVLCGEDVIAVWPRLALSCEWPRLAKGVKRGVVSESGWSGARAPESSAAVPTPSAKDGVRAPSSLNMSLAEMRRFLPDFLKERCARTQASGERFNEVVARCQAEAHFGRRIRRPAFREIYRATGLKIPPGRPRKTRPGETPPKK